MGSFQMSGIMAASLAGWDWQMPLVFRLNGCGGLDGIAVRRLLEGVDQPARIELADLVEPAHGVRRELPQPGLVHPGHGREQAVIHRPARDRRDADHGLGRFGQRRNPGQENRCQADGHDSGIGDNIADGLEKFQGGQYPAGEKQHRYENDERHGDDPRFRDLLRRIGIQPRG